MCIRDRAEDQGFKESGSSVGGALDGVRRVLRCTFLNLGHVTMFVNKAIAFSNDRMGLLLMYFGCTATFR